MRQTLGALVAVLALVAAACGSSDDESSDSTAASTTTSTSPSTTAAPTTSGALETSGSGDVPVELPDDVPDPAGATRESGPNALDVVPGVYVGYSSAESPSDFLSTYSTAVKGSGWTVESGGGQAGTGAGIQASKDGRWLNVQAGAGDAATSIDLCVWPERPFGGDTCSAGSGSASAPTDVPDPEGATKESGPSQVPGVTGVHVGYSTPEAPADFLGSYEGALESNGWTIEGSGSGFGGSSGAGGGGMEASKDGRWIRVDAGTSGEAPTAVNLCVWTQKPAVGDTCEDPAGESDEGVEAGDAIPADAVTEAGPTEIPGVGGAYVAYTTEEAPGDFLTNYSAALTGSGWTIEGGGGGSSASGEGGGGFKAVAGDGRWLEVKAGTSGDGPTAVNLCVWSEQPPGGEQGCDGPPSNPGDVPDEVLAGVPDPAGAARQSGPTGIPGVAGVYVAYTVAEAPQAFLEARRSALNGDGWTIEDVNFTTTDGNLTANKDSEWVALAVVARSDGSFVEQCSWPEKPSSLACTG